jgi:hypothetical protein
MICALCNGHIESKKELYPFRSRVIGTVFVPDVAFNECSSCGEKTLTPEASQYLIDYVRRVEKQALKAIPAGDMITATEAAAILGFTKQNFSKAPKIKIGFIYFIKIGGRKYYSKRSTVQYKDTGDGRFRLTIPDEYKTPDYVDSGPRLKLIEKPSRKVVKQNNINSFWSPEENSEPTTYKAAYK